MGAAFIKARNSARQGFVLLAQTHRQGEFDLICKNLSLLNFVSKKFPLFFRMLANSTKGATMAFLKMMILSVLVSFAAWSEALRCGFCLLSRREIQQDKALSFWLKLIGKVNLT